MFLFEVICFLQVVNPSLLAPVISILRSAYVAGDHDVQWITVKVRFGMASGKMLHLEVRSLWMGANALVVCSVTLGIGSGSARASDSSSSFVTCSFEGFL